MPICCVLLIHGYLLDLSLVDLGKGKRMIVPGGRYDKKISD